MFYDVLCLKSNLGSLLSERTSGVSPVIFITLWSGQLVYSMKRLIWTDCKITSLQLFKSKPAHCWSRGAKLVQHMLTSSSPQIFWFRYHSATMVSISLPEDENHQADRNAWHHTSEKQTRFLRENIPCLNVCYQIFKQWLDITRGNDRLSSENGVGLIVLGKNSKLTADSGVQRIHFGCMPSTSKKGLFLDGSL